MQKQARKQRQAEVARMLLDDARIKLQQMQARGDSLWARLRFTVTAPVSIYRQVRRNV